ncbi:hypothetical protein P43SY_006509 [Pythium insidiosum]|uniref:Uncharacterized protein n=1 Tax=Pythium insidiosum TaxID=114742 RepID=A0AAD5M2F7_PYTIN|nr:hypothetical protein P43SY_006509 [Pythium insidiosum]
MKIAYLAVAALVAVLGMAPTTEAFCGACNDCRNRCIANSEYCARNGGKKCTIMASACHAACLVSPMCLQPILLGTELYADMSAEYVQYLASLLATAEAISMGISIGMYCISASVWAE